MGLVPVGLERLDRDPPGIGLPCRGGERGEVGVLPEGGVLVEVPGVGPQVRDAVSGRSLILAAGLSLTSNRSSVGQSLTSASVIPGPNRNLRSASRASSSSRKAITACRAWPYSASIVTDPTRPAAVLTYS